MTVYQTQMQSDSKSQDYASVQNNQMSMGYSGGVSRKSRTVASVLCIMFGYFGAHHFYAGKGGFGVLYLFTVGLFGIGWIVDIVKTLTGTFTDSNKKVTYDITH